MSVMQALSQFTLGEAVIIGLMVAAVVMLERIRRGDK